MTLSIILAIVAGLLLIIGFVGTFVPVIPGAPLAWLGLLAAYFCEFCEISILMLVITGVLAAVVSVLVNFLPVLMTKNFGGSKAAITGSTIGLIVGLFAGPAGIIIGAFVGFLADTGIKMVCVAFFIWYFVQNFF